ncbi:putative formin-like protein 18 isoform X2 [Iris pallida]|uniref:Formin-like protein 18 isoform X2 n=1 Tax=Iris pallida TaxID=29817 RepID=A0AAX6GW46_IRIPA|nr:putative formin-like protein 18 isoform X2 [Iris pallida]KAJ6832773.1 putative formin-like protein 18 isoform X2 [Iris pallida]
MHASLSPSLLTQHTHKPLLPSPPDHLPLADDPPRRAWPPRPSTSPPPELLPLLILPPPHYHHHLHHQTHHHHLHHPLHSNTTTARPPPPAAVPARWPRTPHPAPRSNAATAAACAQPRARATTAAGDRRRPARTTPAWPPRLGAPPGCPTWQPPSSPTRTIGYSCISHEIPSTRARAKSRIGAPSQRFRADFLVNPTVGSAISLLRRNLVSWSRLRQLVTSPSQLRFVHRQFWCIAGYQASISSY